MMKFNRKVIKSDKFCISDFFSIGKKSVTGYSLILQWRISLSIIRSFLDNGDWTAKINPEIKRIDFIPGLFR